MRIVLVSLYGFEALGVRAIHAYLKERGADVRIVFFKDRLMNEMAPLTDREIDGLVELLSDLRPTLVGISLFSALFDDVAEITARVKEKLAVPVIWGGYHPTIVPEECIQVADMICIGEGEEPMWELYSRMAAGQSYDDIRNLWIRHEKRIIRNELRPLIQDLDSLPFFDYSDDDKYRFDGQRLAQGDPFNYRDGRGSHFQTHYVVQTARGCPFRCSFCSNSILRSIVADKGPYIRQRSVKRVIEELAYARQRFPRLKQITFWDEVFVLNRKWLEEFAREYRQKIGLPFKCSLHPNTITPQVLALLTEAGLTDLVMGIQSGSERVRREVFDRPTPGDKLRRAFAAIHDSGIVPSYDLIVDNPYETQADKDESLEFLLDIPRPYDLRIFSLTHLPSTALTERALQDGIITEFEVEGHNRKALAQWRMTLDHARGKESLFWNSIVSLLPKRFVPKGLIQWMYRSAFLREHPRIVAILATVANFLKTGLSAVELLLSGKIDWSYIKTQWRSALRVAR